MIQTKRTSFLLALSIKPLSIAANHKLLRKREDKQKTDLMAVAIFRRG